MFGNFIFESIEKYGTLEVFDYFEVNFMQSVLFQALGVNQ